MASWWISPSDVKAMSCDKWSAVVSSSSHPIKCSGLMPSGPGSLSLPIRLSARGTCAAIYSRCLPPGQAGQGSLGVVAAG